MMIERGPGTWFHTIWPDNRLCRLFVSNTTYPPAPFRPGLNDKGLSFSFSVATQLKVKWRAEGGVCWLRAEQRHGLSFTCAVAA